MASRLDLEDGRADEVAVVGVAGVLAEDAVPLLLARVHVARYLLELGLAYDRTDVHVGAARRPPILSALRVLHDLVQDLVVDVGVHDGAARGAALLARVAVGALHDVGRRRVEVGRVVDDHRVLAAHLGDDPLDPALVLYLPGRELVDPEPRRHRAGEGDEARPRVLNQVVTDLGAVAGQVVEDALGEAGFLEDLRDDGADDRA